MIAFAIVILPGSLPLEPVLTVTLLLASAACKAATVNTEPLPEGVQVPEEHVSVGEPDAV